MEITSLCVVISATLSIQPDRSQFFRYERLTLSCAVPGSFSGWTVKRNTSTGSFLSCGVDWGRSNGSACSIRSIYSSDTGVYWCESERGQCSNVLNITVHTDAVILESPALPVTEGDKVTLRCSHKGRYEKISTSQFQATFFKDGVFIGSEPEGRLVLPSVSKSNEGFYKCQHPSNIESPQSLLAVRARPCVPLTHPPPSMPLTQLLYVGLLFILYTAIIIVCIYGYRRWAQAKRRAFSHLILE